MDKIKNEYYRLLQQDPAAALAFAQQNGLPVQELSPEQRFKSGSLEQVRKLIGADSTAAPTQMPQRPAPGLSGPVTDSPETGMVSTGKTPEEIQDRVMQSVREAQARQAALRKMAGGIDPSSVVREGELDPLKKKKRPTLETYDAEE